MLFRYKYPGGVWVDLEQPTEDEIRAVAEEFALGERIERELASPTPAPLAVADAVVVLLITHFPTQEIENDGLENQEIDFIVGKNFIITVHYEVVAPLHHLKKLLEARELVDDSSSAFADGDSLATDVLIEVIFAHLYASTRDHMNNVVSRLSRIEQDMFGGRERETVRLISDVSREFLHLEASLASQEEPLCHFFELLGRYNFFDTSFADRVERLLAERTHVAELVTTHRAVATELRETNIALLGAHQNEIMKTLTTVNFIFLPLGLISWIFAMRTEGMPLIDSPNAFWIVLAIMFSVALLLAGFFIKRRWL